jgi:hypothetical protein
LSTFSEVFLCYIDIWFITDFENISSEDKESSDDSTKEYLEDISNEGKELCVDVGKKGRS